MMRIHPFRFSVLGGLLATLALASPLLAEVTFPTAIELEKNMYFQKPDGEPIQLQAGTYEIERGSANQLNVIPTQSKEAVTMAIQAIPASHEQQLEHPHALLTPAPDHNQDREHLLLWMPGGEALEAVGSYSGVFSRSTVTWGTQADDNSIAGNSVPCCSITFTDPIYFRTVDGDPQAIQPGDYMVFEEDKGVRLVKLYGQDPNGIRIETSPLDHAAAALLPRVGSDYNLSRLLITYPSGRSVVAIGSNDGTYSRGRGAAGQRRIAKQRERMKEWRDRLKGKKSIEAKKESRKQEIFKPRLKPAVQPSQKDLKARRELGRKARMTAAAWKAGKKRLKGKCRLRQKKCNRITRYLR